MKIFVDTNIFLDVLLARENYPSSLRVLEGVPAGEWEGVVLDITLLNIDYVARKQTKDIRGFLSLVNDVFKVIGAGNEEMEEALAMETPDLEDNLQYLCALRSGCELIVSNDRDFVRGKIPVMSSGEFVKRAQSNL
jgi:predicted nucleic acid-binding protein